eukprot:533184-Pleurochrysis_carterae.AAC.1
MGRSQHLLGMEPLRWIVLQVLGLGDELTKQLNIFRGGKRERVKGHWRWSFGHSDVELDFWRVGRESCSCKRRPQRGCGGSGGGGAAAL